MLTVPAWAVSSHADSPSYIVRRGSPLTLTAQLLCFKGVPSHADCPSYFIEGGPLSC